MKTFELHKTTGAYSYILSVQNDCKTSPRGNVHCATGGQHVFLTDSDLANLKEALNEAIPSVVQSKEEDDASGSPVV